MALSYIGLFLIIILIIFFGKKIKYVFNLVDMYQKIPARHDKFMLTN